MLGSENQRSSEPESKFLASYKHYSLTTHSVSTYDEVARSRAVPMVDEIHKGRAWHSNVLSRYASGFFLLALYDWSMCPL